MALLHVVRIFTVRRVALLAFGAALTALAGLASAVPLNPGGMGETSTAMTGTYSVAGDTYAGGATQTFTGTEDGLDFNFTIYTNYYSNPNRGGEYDFVYQLVNNDAAGDPNGDSFARLTLSSFAGYSVDADYESSTGSSAGLAQSDPTNPVAGADMYPNEVDRLTPITVGYDFQSPANLIGPQDASDLLIVQTNATSAHMGAATVLDNGRGSVLTDVPFGGVVLPEPASFGLLAAASLGVLSRRRRSLK